MRRIAVLPAAACALALGGAPTASAVTPVAAWPTVKSYAVVVPVSIAGLKLGASYADMTKLYGAGSSCGQEDAAALAAGQPAIDRTALRGDCRWSDPGQAYGGSVTVSFLAGKVVSIALNGAQNTKTYFPVAKGPVAKFVITKGKTKLHIASSIQSFIKAFPTFESTGAGVAVTKGKATLGVSSSGGHIAAIVLETTAFANS